MFCSFTAHRRLIRVVCEFDLVGEIMVPPLVATAVQARAASGGRVCGGVGGVGDVGGGGVGVDGVGVGVGVSIGDVVNCRAFLRRLP